MKKKSVILFILWAVATFVLTSIYLALMFFRHPQMPDVGWILSLCIAGMTFAMMSLIRINAKAEKITWLAVVSKVLLIVYSALGAAGVLMFILSRLLV